MLTEEERRELDKLVAMGMQHGNRLNSSLVVNVYLGFPVNDRDKQELYDVVLSYLESGGIEIINDGVEPDEEETETRLEKVRPFNPGKIDIDMKTMEMSSLIKRIQYEEVDMKTAFQRKSGLWSAKQKSQLIESLMLRIPLPAFYFDGGNADKWLIIDGLQRITAIKEFVVDETLKLTGLEFFEDLEGATFSDLPRALTRRIEETNIIAFIVKEGTPQNVKYNIFKRINTGGLQLTPQEIRHALYQGPAVDLCKKLAKNTAFIRATCGSVSPDRMMDQEFVLRFVAVCYYGPEKYDGVPDNYLNEAMEYLNAVNCIDEAVIEKQFERVMWAAENIMGRYAFRKLGMDPVRRPINKAIYEVWCWIFFHCEEKQLSVLIQKKQDVYTEFQQLCQDSQFLAAIKSSDKRLFGQRFRMVGDIVRRILSAEKIDSTEF